jgi:hypothetical protein
MKKILALMLLSVVSTPSFSALPVSGSQMPVGSVKSTGSLPVVGNLLPLSALTIPTSTLSSILALKSPGALRGLDLVPTVRRLATVGNVTTLVSSTLWSGRSIASLDSLDRQAVVADVAAQASQVPMVGPAVSNALVVVIKRRSGF